MKTKLATLFTLVAGLSLAAIGAARAEDFTLTVPVRLNSLHPLITGAAINCGVGTASDHVNDVGLGSAQISIDPNSGNFSQNVVIRFNATTGRDPSTATAYRCVIFLSGSGFGGFTSNPGCSSCPITNRAKAGTPFTPSVSGSLPQ